MTMFDLKETKGRILNMNINDYENFLTIEMGIPNVSLSALTVVQAKEVTEALKVIFYKYPDLKKSICAIGDTESINNQMNLIRFSLNPNEKWEDFPHDNANMSMCTLKNRGLIFRLFNMPMVFTGLCFEEGILSDKFETEMIKAVNLGIATKYTASVKGIVYHEIGHLLDQILNISNSKEFNQILTSKNWNILTEVDFHAGSSLNELIAEAFSEYISNPTPSELVTLLGQLIDKKYIESKGKMIFNINYKYKNFLEKVEKEMNPKSR